MVDSIQEGVRGLACFRPYQGWKRVSKAEGPVINANFGLGFFLGVVEVFSPLPLFPPLIMLDVVYGRHRPRGSLRRHEQYVVVVANFEFGAKALPFPREYDG
jgi:hypothetical protein